MYTAGAQQKLVFRDRAVSHSIILAIWEAEIEGLQFKASRTKKLAIPFLRKQVGFCTLSQKAGFPGDYFGECQNKNLWCITVDSL
jgi:hypothetical protein